MWKAYQLKSFLREFLLRGYLLRVIFPSLVMTIKAIYIYIHAYINLMCYNPFRIALSNMDPMQRYYYVLPLFN